MNPIYPLVLIFGSLIAAGLSTGLMLAGIDIGIIGKISLGAVCTLIAFAAFKP